MSVPTRSNTVASTASGSAVSDESSTSALVQAFIERLRAWKHVVADLEKYTEILIKIYNTRGKEYESDIVSLLSRPLREGNHFSTARGGVVELFESMRENSLRLVNDQHETAKTLKSTILPIFDRLHSDIKKRSSDLEDGIAKSLKVVDKSRKEAQKQIELLSQQVTAFDTNTPAGATTATVAKFAPDEDPYILHRQARSRLYKLITEQNNHRKDLLSVQNDLGEFETYIVKTIRSGIEQLSSVVSNEAVAASSHYRNVSAVAAGIQPSFEWQGFVQREGPQGANLLASEAEEPETLDNTEFVNMSHRSVMPVLAGALERQTASKRMMGLGKKFSPVYVVITPAGYLHQFPPDEVTVSSSAPSSSHPELSLYLPECTVPVDQPAPDQFSVHGKDISKRLAGIKLSGYMTHDLVFKATSPTEAVRWLEVARGVAKGELNDMLAGGGAAARRSTSSPMSGQNSAAVSPSAARAAAPVAAPGAAAALPHQTEMVEKSAGASHPMTAGPEAPPAYVPSENPSSVNLLGGQAAPGAVAGAGAGAPPVPEHAPAPGITTAAAIPPVPGHAPATSTAPHPPVPGNVPVSVPATTTTAAAAAAAPTGPPAPTPAAAPAPTGGVSFADAAPSSYSPPRTGYTEAPSFATQQPQPQQQVQQHQEKHHHGLFHRHHDQQQQEYQIAGLAPTPTPTTTGMPPQPSHPHSHADVPPAPAPGAVPTATGRAGQLQHGPDVDPAALAAAQTAARAHQY